MVSLACNEKGVQSYSLLYCSPAKPGEETHQGSRHRILPPSPGVPCQRSNRPGQYWHPFAEDPAVHPRQCRKTFTYKGTRLLPAAHRGETVVMVITLLAHGCPTQAAWRPSALMSGRWRMGGRERADGAGVHEWLVEHPHDLGQVQADEIRVKKRGRHCLDGAGADDPYAVVAGWQVSAHRDMTLIRRLIERVRRGAAPRALGLYRRLECLVRGHP